VSSTCLEHPSVHHQQDLYMPFYGISFKHPYNLKAACTIWRSCDRASW